MARSIRKTTAAVNDDDVADVERGRDAAADTLASPPRLRLASVATAIAVLGFVGLAVQSVLSEGSLWTGALLRLRVAPLLPMAILGWAVFAVRTPKLGAQLLCRAAWWSSLIVGVLVSLNYGSPIDKSCGAAVSVGCAVALLAVAERGLDIREVDHPFAPVRFRGHLLLALVMAAADAATLTFSGLMQLRFGVRGWSVGSTVEYAGPTVAAAVVMAVAVWGVYRLRTWALLLNLVANVAIAYLALEGALRLSPSVSVSLAATAAVQCFIPVPILASALGDRDAGQPFMAPVGRWLMRGAVVALAGYAIYNISNPVGDGWVDGPGRAFVRGGYVHRDTPSPAILSPGEDSDPRVRLGATDQDLRGRSFDGEPMARVDFSGADLREASFVGAGLRRAKFSSAQLDGAYFRDAILYDSSFDGASLEGADFTGALAPHLWLEGSTGAVTCPNGAASSPSTGCDGQLGHAGSFQRQSLTVVSAVEKDGCPHVGHVSVTGRTPEHLRVLGRPYVKQASGGYRSTFGALSTDGKRWTLESPYCGRVEFEAEPKPIPRYVKGQFEVGDSTGRMQGENFEELVLTYVEFGRKSLAGSHFGRAELRESGALFLHADLKKADFTGALTTAENWRGVGPSSLHRTTCPDGREADSARGCADRRGTYGGALPGPLQSRGAACGDAPLGTFAMDGEFLAFDGVPFVLLDEGGFVSPHPDYELDRSLDGTWELTTPGCRTVWAAAADTDAG